MSFFDKLSESLQKTSANLRFALGERPDADFYEQLEERLILADAGAATAAQIVAQVEDKVKQRRILTAEGAMDAVRETVTQMLTPEQPLRLDGKPAVLLLIGVNGAGKTTTAGKLANYYARQGRKVLLAAADTFRAAAVEQLCIWGERAGVEVVKNEASTDPAAVIFDAVSAASSRGCEIVICDTAGRLHTKKNLMDELAKMSRIICKACGTASVETLLTIDAVTGQNAVNQAAQFADAAGVDGIVLTKLDGTAKGGAVLAVRNSLGIPVRFVGVGEGIDDLMEFNAADYAAALFKTDENR